MPLTTPAPKTPAASTPMPAPTSSPGTSSYMKILNGNALPSGAPNTNPYFLPTTTITTDLTQTSQPDIESLVNATMQQLVGRNATPDEIKQYGAELLAAEKANTGGYTGVTTYQIDSGKRNTAIGTQLSKGVDVTAFLENLINGTAGAKEYKAATGYMQAMMNSMNQFKGAYNG